MTEATKSPAGTHAVPPLGYGYAELEPVIDEATMRLHHDKHHQAYVDALNAALSKHPDFARLGVEDLLRRLGEVPEDIRQAVRNNGGGHANHSFFWNILTPRKSAGPSGLLSEAIQREFGGLDTFKERFQDAGARQFGSGWAFLVARPKQDFKLEILTLPNQDSPLSLPDSPPVLLACDLWEHAYYLKYNNRRPEWLKAWWGVVNWDHAGQRLAALREGKPLD
jgi:Fe-Mn family superoxide dismutase